MSNFISLMALALSETVKKANGKKERKQLATVQIPCPILSEFGITQAVQAVYDKDDPEQKQVKGAPVIVDGIPVYSDPKWDWLQQAICGKVAATVRNRYVKGVLKQGATIPADFEQLTAETQRTGEALALRRDAKASFEAYLQSLNKKALTVQQLGELFYNSAKVLSSAGENYIKALALHVGNWIPTLSDANKTRFAPKIMELQESINAAQGQDDLESDLM